MSTITEYANNLERDLLQSHELLKGGLKHAIKELKHSAKEAGKKADSTEVAKLKALESISEEAIDQVEEKLGIINYLEAEEEIDSLEEFDRLTNPLSEALTQARATLVQVEKIGDDLHNRSGSDLGSDLDNAWHKLHVQLEMVRLHLALEALETDTSLEEIRAQLASAFAEAAQKAPQDWEQSENILWKAFSTIGDLTKTAGRSLNLLFDGTKKAED